MAQIGFRQRVHAVVMDARVHRIGHEHGVIDRRHADSAAGEDLGIIFHVLPDLQDRGVLEHGLQDRQRLGLGHLPFGKLGRPEQVIDPAAMPERDVAGECRFGGKRDADQTRPHFVKAGGFGIHRHIALVADACDPCL